MAVPPVSVTSSPLDEEHFRLAVLDPWLAKELLQSRFHGLWRTRRTLLSGRRGMLRPFAVAWMYADDKCGGGTLLAIGRIRDVWVGIVIQGEQEGLQMAQELR